jgi:septal ring factor EnvC (AmiA/AmiB activator)
MRNAAALAWCLVALAAAPALHAQDAQRDIRASQLRLDAIRQERQLLQQELDELQSRVRDASREAANIGRQRDASTSLLHELEFQSEVLHETMEETAASLAATQARLRSRTNDLNARLRTIYKRGRLHALRVMLGAESFGDLLNRYKYLHMMTMYERMMIEEIGRLEQALVRQNESLRQTLAQIEGLRVEKEAEIAAFERIEAQHARALRQYEQERMRTAGTIEQLTRDERQLATLIADMERRRLEGARRDDAAGRPTAPGAISTRSLGSLNWPVDGDVVYRFGPERKPSGIILRHNGIGIAAQAGTPVRAVEAGIVELARPFEGSGPTVMLSHGGGYYTLYMYLSSIAVRAGDEVSIGQTIGAVGGAQTPEGPRLEFQVWAPLQGGSPRPVDPLDWLRRRASL